MNKPTRHTAPDHRYRLPEEVLAALTLETEEDRARLIEAWELAGYYLDDEPAETTFRRLGAEIRQNLEVALQAPAPRLRLVKAPLRLVTSRTLRWAAAAACVALLVTVGLFYGRRPFTVTAPNGVQLAHTLPDGSTLTLNSGSTIRYGRAFGETERQVRLVDGEVLFEVTRGASPFSVETFNGTVTVLGTTFNVRARPHDVEPATTVAVASGTVQLVPRRHLDHAVLLEAGQSARLTSPSVLPVALDSADTQHALGWRDGAFKFRAHALGTVIQEIERRFDVRVTVASERLLALPVGILMENPLGAEEILRDICGLDSCQYRAVPGGYEIVQPDAD